ncbi:MAG: hypothetical protein WC748_03135 [Legionellales bacterium]|jgi:hypothetical protein
MPDRLSLKQTLTDFSDSIYNNFTYHLAKFADIDEAIQEDEGNKLKEQLRQKILRDKDAELLAEAKKILIKFFPGQKISNVKEQVLNIMVDSRTDEINNKVKQELNKLLDEKLEPDNKTRRQKLIRSFFSANVLISLLGLNIGYLAIHTFIMWQWHIPLLAALGLTTALTSWILIIPLIPFVALSIWHAKSVMKKNILYHENLNIYLKAYNEIKKSTTVTIEQETELLRNFTTQHADYISYTNTQVNLNPWKVAARTLFYFSLFTAVLISGVTPVILIAAVVCAAFFALLDYEAQTTEKNQDIELKQLLWETIELKKIKVKALDAEKNIQLDRPKNVFMPVMDKTIKNIENITTPISAGYIPFGFISLFGFHLFVASLGVIALTTALWTIPALALIGIVYYNVKQNEKFYKFHFQEKARLLQEKDELEYKIKMLSEEKELILDKLKKPLFMDHLSKTSKDTHKKAEDFKKRYRPFFMGGSLSGVSVAIFTPLLALPLTWAILAIGAIAITAFLAGKFLGDLDWKVRTAKENIEKENHELKMENLALLNKVEILVEKTESLPLQQEPTKIFAEEDNVEITLSDSPEVKVNSTNEQTVCLLNSNYFEAEDTTVNSRVIKENPDVHTDVLTIHDECFCPISNSMNILAASSNVIVFASNNEEGLSTTPTPTSTAPITTSNVSSSPEVQPKSLFYYDYIKEQNNKVNKRKIPDSMGSTALKIRCA